jgi:translocation protein SEC72
MDLSTFHQLPLQIDGQTKAITTPTPTDHALTTELQALNTLHRTLITTNVSQAIPPPPIPVDPKRSAQITKMRETGNTALRKGQHGEAIKLYSLGIDMALGRPPWEPSGLVREELSQLYANRAQGYMAAHAWAEGSVDAQCSVELKRVGNSKAWWRRGQCLVEMGRLEEAKTWMAEAVEFEGQEKELLELSEEIKKKLERTEK